MHSISKDKRMVALYFTIFPKEAEKLIEDSKKYEEQEEERLEKLYKDTHKYINSLSKKRISRTIRIYFKYSTRMGI